MSCACPAYTLETTCYNPALSCLCLYAVLILSRECPETVLDMSCDKHRINNHRPIYPIERRGFSASLDLATLSVDNCVKGDGEWNFVDGFDCSRMHLPDKICADRRINSFDIPRTAKAAGSHRALLSAKTPKIHRTQGATVDLSRREEATFNISLIFNKLRHVTVERYRVRNPPLPTSSTNRVAIFGQALNRRFFLPVFLYQNIDTLVLCQNPPISI